MLPRVCRHIHGLNRRQSARCPYLLGSPGVLCLRAAADVPMPPGVPPRLAVDATAACAALATPTRPLQVSYYASPPSVGTPHTMRRLPQTSVSSQSLVSVLSPRESQNLQPARPGLRYPRSLALTVARYRVMATESSAHACSCHHRGPGARCPHSGARPPSWRAGPGQGAVVPLQGRGPRSAPWSP